MATEINVLKQKRGVIKGRVTRFNTFLSQLDLENIEEKSVNQLQLKLEKIEPVWDEFLELQTEIEVIENEIDSAERQEFEDLYCELVAMARSICQNYSENKRSESSEQSSRQSANLASNNHFPLQSVVQLPPIKIPTFDGNYTNWLDYKETFLSLVDQNNTLSDIQKLVYLRSSLEKDPLQLIKSVELPATNYRTAWKLILDRYENKKIIVHSHIRAIFEYPIINNESYISLRQLFDNVNKHLHALNAMGEKTDYWDRLMIYIISSKFDISTKREWESYHYEGELPTWQDMKIFLKNRCEILEKLEFIGNDRRSKSFNMKKSNISSSYTVTENLKLNNCPHCSKNHGINVCPLFLNSSVNDRIAKIKSLKLCLNCLKGNHPFWKCRFKKCDKCKKSHNTLLHIENRQPSNYPIENNIQSEPVSNNNAAFGNTENSGQRNRLEVSGKEQAVEYQSVSGISSCSLDCLNTEEPEFSQVLLSTAVIKIFNGENFIKCRALLDSGSQSNFITEKLCKQLNLKLLKINHTVKGVGTASSNINKQVNIKIGSFHSAFEQEIQCLVLQKITDRLPLMSFNKNLLNLSNDWTLADPTFNINNDVDMLIGANLFWEILGSEQISLGKNLPVLRDSKFGWLVAGNLNLSSQNKNYSICNLNIDQNAGLEKLLINFWNIEEVQSKDRLHSESERFCEDHFQKTKKRDETGRFIVEMPFKENLQELGKTKHMTLKRFQNLEKRLGKDEKLKKEYSDIFDEYERLGHMIEICLQENEYDEGYFLPHHMVVKESSLTTKCRVVFDASAKSSTGLSLNDVQHSGPTLQQDVFSILLRFRKHKYVMTADVSKMYRQIKMCDNHKKYLRIFWRKNPSDIVKCYELQTVTFGTAAAPFLAVRCLIELAIENNKNAPLASKIITNDFYMDDLLTGADSFDELVELQKSISQILSSGGFQLRKWLSNNKEAVNLFDVKNNDYFNILHIGEHEANKTLGVFWNSHKDTIQYIIKEISVNAPASKRTIMSTICQIFDPLGLLGPIVVVAKLLIQVLWKFKIDWDEQVPNEIYRKWQNFIKQLPIINEFIIPRQVSISTYIRIELHGFSDSSEKAYGACIYVRCVLSSGNITSKLLCAKSRVAPVKKVSLPRLELNASVLLANLSQNVCIALEISFDKKYFWTDSMITLSWIKSDSSRWKTFVANRVSEIQSLTDTRDWYHIESSKNPADLLSRGTTPELLRKNNLWWFGPDFLATVEENWNINTALQNLQLPEEKSVNLIIINTSSLIKELLIKYSCIKKIQRILAYVLRFINRIKKRNNFVFAVGSKSDYVLRPTELDNAINLIISEVQKDTFAEEYRCLKANISLNKKSKLLSLNPFMQDDLIRVGGRLKNSTFEFDKKHPILLPKSHILTDLIVRNEHERLLHCASQLLLCSLREKYWPLAGRNICKKICRTCIICCKARPTTSSYLMGDLPSVRVSPNMPFSNVGIDYGGPYCLKDRKGRGAKITKAYVCLFVCMSTKALHLELVSNLSTDGFISTLKRFIGRRGRPTNIYSDNGSNFVGANNELSKMNEFLVANSQYISEYLSSDQICWHFIPARSPNFGGLWETGIKSVKYHLKRVMSNTPYTFEDFSTILCQVEAILNSRPLLPLSSDPEDFAALTPGHFLIGRHLMSLPEYDLHDIQPNRLDHYQQLQVIIQHFWKRWQKEYVSELQHRTKWRQRSNQLLEIGSMVMVKTENSAVLNWKLGRIVKVFPGTDEVIRVVDIKTPTGVIRRSINSVCCLPLE